MWSHFPMLARTSIDWSLSIVLMCVFFLPQCPTFKREADGTETPEPFAAEAKFFTESRLLQRDVQIILESCPNQIILGTILHPVGTQEVAPVGELDIQIQAFCLINCPFLVPSVTEWQHHRTPAERRLRPLCWLVHGCLYPGSWETQSRWEVRSCTHRKNTTFFFPEFDGAEVLNKYKELRSEI